MVGSSGRLQTVSKRCLCCCCCYQSCWLTFSSRSKRSFDCYLCYGYCMGVLSERKAFQQCADSCVVLCWCHWKCCVGQRRAQGKVCLELDSLHFHIFNQGACQTLPSWVATMKPGNICDYPKTMSFTELLSKTLSTPPRHMQWCPTMDLLAYTPTPNTLAIHRLSWQVCSVLFVCSFFVCFLFVLMGVSRNCM